METPILHFHPLSSCCQKVLIAAHVLDVALDARLLNLGDPVERAAFRALWPLGKMPLLVEQGRPIGETSIIIEHLQRHHAADGPRLIPQDPAQALEVRFWDRVCDLYVMTPMQALTAALLQPASDAGGAATATARATLLNSYALLDRQVTGDAGWRARRSPWPIALRHRRCSMPWPTCRCRTRTRHCLPMWSG